MRALPTPPPPPPLPKRLRASFSQTGRTLALVWRSSPRAAVALGVLTIISAGLGPAMAWVGKLIVDAVVAARAEGGVHVDRALRLVALELGLVVTMGLVDRALGVVRQTVGSRLSVDVNVMILDKALTLDLRHFEDPDFYDKLVRARREASSRPLALVEQNLQLVRNALTVAGYIAILSRFSGLMILALLASTVPAFISEARFSTAAFRMRNWRSPETRKLNYLEHVLANDEHAKEVKLFGLGPVLLDRYRALAERFHAEDRRLALRRAIWGYLLSLVSMGTFYAGYAFIAVAAVRGTLSLGDMTLYLVAFRQGQQGFQSILAALGSLYEHNLYMSNLFDYLAIPTGPTGPAVAPAGPVEAAGPRTGVRFEDVGFRYPGAADWALRGVTLDIPPGRSLALVGENGAGKTTFIKLLTRLYRPTEGRILLDGRDLATWDEEALRRRLGVIFQDFNQYQLVLRENVAFGSVEHKEDEVRIARAVDQGGAREVVTRLAAGLETQLGRWFRDGVELSGGQWQKVALARAFMREEADILILDEPTAALDAEAEHAVFERFKTLARGRTTILISHRFSTVRMADEILVFDRGRIVERGDHATLLASGGRYAHLFTLQAAGYR
jgi:ATP-binding cassette subfamily B protein